MNATRTSPCVPLALLMTLCALLVAGCEGSTKRGTVYNIKPDRRIEAFLPGDTKTVHGAAVAVVRDDFAYAVRRDAIDATGGVVEASTARGEAVRVDTYVAGGSVTRIEIKVGVLGDVEAAREILTAIEARLKQ